MVNIIVRKSKLLLSLALVIGSNAFAPNRHKHFASKKCPPLRYNADGEETAKDTPKNNRNLPAQSSSTSIVSQKSSSLLPFIPEEPSPEWHESFLRNGLGDFVPPVRELKNLDCLLVGDGLSPQQSPCENDDNATNDKNKVLPWEQEDSQTNIYTLSSPPSATTTTMHANNSYGKDEEEDSSITKSLDTFMQHLTDAVQAEFLTTDMPHQQTYDCIFDRGLVDAMLDQSVDRETLAAVLHQACLVLREYGIYVMTTKSLSTSTKEYLTILGEEMGMMWKFGLDGISDDEFCVSVARRFDAAPMNSSPLDDRQRISCSIKP